MSSDLVSGGCPESISARDTAGNGIDERGGSCASSWRHRGRRRGPPTTCLITCLEQLEAAWLGRPERRGLSNGSRCHTVSLGRAADGDRIRAFDAYRTRILALPDAIDAASPERARSSTGSWSSGSSCATGASKRSSGCPRRGRSSKDSGSTPKGIRTPVATLKGWRPRPLDDGGTGRPESSRGSDRAPARVRAQAGGRETRNPITAPARNAAPMMAAMPPRRASPIARPLRPSMPARQTARSE